MNLNQDSNGVWRAVDGRSLPPVDELAGLYGNVAGRWHRAMGRLGYVNAYSALIRQVAADGWLTGLHARTHVLDCGIGSGALSLAINTTFHGSPTLHGIDISWEMLAQARKNLIASGAPAQQIRLNHGNCNAMPYSADFFSLVMGAHFLEHSRTPGQTLAQMVRVLKSGAPLLLITTRSKPTNSLQGLRWRYQPIPPDELCAWMRNAGLRGIRRYPLGTTWSWPNLFSEAYIGTKS